MRVTAIETPETGKQKRIGFMAGEFKLHELKGDRAGMWSVTVSGNWRVTFRFSNGDAEVVNYEDYH